MSGPAAAGPAINEASVRSHLEFLASDAMNGRGSGTRDEWIAASYLAAQMRKWGLEPLGDNGGFVKAVNLESFDVAAPPVLTVGDTRLAHGKEMIATAVTAPQISGRLQKYTPGADVGPQAAVLMPELDQALAAATSRAAVTLVKASPANLKNWTQIASRPVSFPVRIVDMPATSRPARVLVHPDTYAQLERMADGTTVTLDVQVKAAARSQTWNAMGRLTGRDPSLVEGSDPAHGAPRSSREPILRRDCRRRHDLQRRRRRCVRLRGRARADGSARDGDTAEARRWCSPGSAARSRAATALDSSSIGRRCR